MIRMQGIRKEYHMGDSVLAALDGVDIHIKPHEFVSIIGPSGSGKSTLMNIIGCLDTADEGIYYLDGQEIDDYSEDELADIRGRWRDIPRCCWRTNRRATSIRAPART